MKAGVLKLLYLFILAIICFACDAKPTAGLQTEDSISVGSAIDMSENPVVTEPITPVDTAEFAEYGGVYGNLLIYLMVSNPMGNKIIYQLKVNGGGKWDSTTGLASLISLEDSLGGYAALGTAIQADCDGGDFYCDATFADYAKDLNFSIGLEVYNRKRISLVLYRSKRSSFPDGVYTLYKIKRKKK